MVEAYASLVRRVDRSSVGFESGVLSAGERVLLRKPRRPLTRGNIDGNSDGAISLLTIALFDSQTARRLCASKTIGSPEPGERFENLGKLKDLQRGHLPLCSSKRKTVSELENVEC